MVCDNAFINAFRCKTKPVSRKIVDEVLEELHWKKKSPRRRWVPAGASAGLVLLACSLLIPHWRNIATDSTEFRSETVAREEHPAPKPEESGKEAQRSGEGVPLPVVSEVDPAPAATLPVIETQKDRDFGIPPAIGEEKTLAEKPEERIEMVAGQPEAPPVERSDAPAVLSGDTPLREPATDGSDSPTAIPVDNQLKQPETPPEDKSIANTEVTVPTREAPPEVSSPPTTEVDTDPTALFDLIDEIIQKRTKK